MSYNGSGTFNINSTGQPVVAGTVITASAFNALTTDLATGLTTAITKDGQTTTTARITFAQGITSSLVTDSSSVSTGSIITAGGAGIAKNLYVGVNANVAGTLGVTGVATFSAAPIYSSLTASSAVATDASKGLVSVTNTGTGNNVLATSPTITTPTISSLSSAAATALTLQSAGTTAITVDTSQNVGIGTASPTTKLHVVGRLNVVGSVGTISTDSQGLTLDLNRAGTTGITNNNASGVLTLGTATNEVMRLDSSGNVGIGTSSPAQRLEVASATGGTIGLRYVGNTGYATIGTNSNNEILFSIGNPPSSGERMRISSGGNLLVGTTSGTAKLNVTTTTASGAAVTFDGSVGNGILMQTTYASATGGTYISFANSAGASTGTISQTGTTTVAYATSSDYRLKENIVPMTGALAKVAQLKPVTYTWKEDGSDSQGFIAHELAEVCPDAVVGTKDELDKDGNPKYQSIDTSFLVATLTAAIQELSAKNDALTARIVALESK